jgi:hypothetical protein
MLGGLRGIAYQIDARSKRQARHKPSRSLGTSALPKASALPIGVLGVLGCRPPGAQARIPRKAQRRDNAWSGHLVARASLILVIISLFPA